MRPSALIVCAAPAAGAADLLRVLAPDADLLIGVDGGALVCARAGLTPDVIVGDLDSLPSDAEAEFRSASVRFRVFDPQKDVSDLDLAIAEARRLGAASVTVTAAWSGRIDHTLAAVGSLAGAADLWPRLIEPGQAGWILDHRYRDTLPVPARTVFSVLTLDPDTSVSVEGARWPLDRVVVPVLSSLGVSNVASVSGSSVRVHAGCALVTQCESGASARPG